MLCALRKASPTPLSCFQHWANPLAPPLRTAGWNLESQPCSCLSTRPSAPAKSAAIHSADLPLPGAPATDVSPSFLPPFQNVLPGNGPHGLCLAVCSRAATRTSISSFSTLWFARSSIRSAARTRANAGTLASTMILGGGLRTVTVALCRGKALAHTVTLKAYRLPSRRTTKGVCRITRGADSGAFFSCWNGMSFFAMS
jgi:hypothetical protein